MTTDDFIIFSMSMTPLHFEKIRMERLHLTGTIENKFIVFPNDITVNISVWYFLNATTSLGIFENFLREK